MSLLFVITFLLTLGYIKSMSIPSIQHEAQQEQLFEPDNTILIDSSDILSSGRFTNDLKNNKNLIEKILQARNLPKMNSESDYIDGFTTDQEIKKRFEKNNLKNSEELVNYQSSHEDCSKKHLADVKLLDDDYEILMQKYKLMQNILASLGFNYFEDLTNSGLNSSGRREGPLYAEEPKYIVIPKDGGNDLLDSSGFKDFFIPPRGRKQMPLLEKIKNHYELFVPNRGKKATNTKKDKIKDIFKYNDLFFPNRGKKNALNGRNILLKKKQVF
ncbi:uncharacterized protein LOC129614240 [Condylostylus longicornis]|uniref:uncharacterized protein LOC129614240 n=1 Tax=Condylostylus longicornis TaxID=2530218 RepID=UPI00244DD7EE|nr:uncharacterized protein LOC129614240 [Condylostylus longicornis]